MTVIGLHNVFDWLTRCTCTAFSGMVHPNIGEDAVPAGIAVESSCA